MPEFADQNMKTVSGQMKARLNSTCEQGFTLIEVVVSLAIFAIGILACYAMQLKSTVSTGRANSVQVASTWASYLAEDFLTLDYTDPLLENSAGDAIDGLTDIDDTDKVGDTPDGVRYISADGTVSSVPSPADVYAIFWNVVANRPLEDLKQVRITVVKNGGLNAGTLYSHDYYKLRNNF